MKDTTPVIRPEFSLWLDAFRWTAAFLVLLSHTQTLFFTLMKDLPTPKRTFSGEAFAFLAGFGTQAVIVFFVISGYLVGGPLLQRMLQRRPLALRYYIAKRVLRLGIVMWPTLILTLMFDLAAMSIRDPSMFLPVGVHQTLSLGTFFCNAVFLQTSACRTFGGDGPLWSLYNEFWYYVTWPMVLCGLLASLAGVGRAAILAALILLLIILGVSQSAEAQLAIVPYMAIWIFGAIAFNITRQPVWLATTIFLVLMLGIRLCVRRDNWLNGHTARLLLDFPFAIAFANLLVALRFQRSLPKPYGGRLHNRLAGFSYSLYCVHMPTLMLLGTWMFYRWGVGAHMALDSVFSAMILFGVLASTVAFAYAFSLATEAHTDRIRHWALKAFGPFSPRAGQSAAP
jgi:peptidoglycan/LPS O-acetylase OafA/YrhL